MAHPHNQHHLPHHDHHDHNNDHHYHHDYNHHYHHEHDDDHYQVMVSLDSTTAPPLQAAQDSPNHLPDTS